MDYLIDTNILIDKLLVRREFFEKSNLVIRAAIYGKIRGHIITNQFSDLYYIIRSAGLSDAASRQELIKLLEVFNIVSLDQEDCDLSLKNPQIPDFEDALISSAAKRAGLKRIITRNPKDFENSGLIVFSPDEIIEKHGLQ